MLQTNEVSSAAVTFEDRLIIVAVRLWGRMGRDDRLTDARHPRLQAFAAAALRIGAGPLYHQEKFLGEQFRLVQSGRLAQAGQSFTLATLERIDHGPAGVASLGEFHCGIGQETAALLAARELGGHAAKPGIEPRPRVRMSCLQSLPERVRTFGEATQALDDEVVFRGEVPIERHLVGAGRLGDGFDAHGPNSMEVKKLVRGREDALARRHAGTALRFVKARLTLHCLGPLTRVLPVSTYRVLPVSTTAGSLSHVVSPGVAVKENFVMIRRIAHFFILPLRAFIMVVATFPTGHACGGPVTGKACPTPPALHHRVLHAHVAPVRGRSRELADRPIRPCGPMRSSGLGALGKEVEPLRADPG
jgi:hypothetical protein